MGSGQRRPRINQMKNSNSIFIVLILTACGQQKSEISTESASRQFCGCFDSRTTGSVDDRLSPCMQEIADKKNNEWNNSGLTDPDSIKSLFADFSLTVMLDMMRT